jgi:serine/threonine protein kinase
MESQVRFPCVLFSLLIGFKVDIWAVGCILGELLRRKPLFPGKDCKVYPICSCSQR